MLKDQKNNGLTKEEFNVHGTGHWA